MTISGMCFQFLIIYVSDCLECFNLIMTGLLDLLVPLKKLRVRQQECPWLSNGSLASSCCTRDIAHYKA